MQKLKSEQQEVINHNEGNILVSASAGSGKTFAMIQRLVRLIVEKRAKVSEVMAVTFTDASALDMKNKLREALIAKINEGSTFLSAELNDIGMADIGTLHSFSARLIRNYFYVVGISPDFKILDQPLSTALRLECVDRVFRSLYASKDNDFLKLVDRFSQNRSDEQFKENILSLYAKLENEVDKNLLIKKCEEAYSEQGFKAILKEIYSELFNRLDDLQNKAYECLNYFQSINLKSYVEVTGLILSLIKELKNTDIYGAKNLLNYGIRFPSIRKGDQVVEQYKDTVKGIYAVIKEAQKSYGEYLTTYQDDLQKNQTLKQMTLSILHIVKLFEEEYSRSKMEDNVLDFSDLEHLALKVLDDEKTRKDVREKYKFIFVDEYQDINYVQEAILSKISNNNLFMVGDAKQSIYGFRGCRPEIFERKYVDMQERGEKVVRLNYNFRCADQIIQMVNQVFGYCMTEDIYGMSYNDNSRLISGGVYDESCPGRAYFHLFNEEEQEKEEEKARIYDLLEEAMRDDDCQVNSTASYVSRIIRKELSNHYYERDNEGNLVKKQITFSDICVLTRSGKNEYVKSLVEGLIRHGVPVCSSVEQNICAYPEIALLINLLKLLDCASQSLPLAIVLKSPIGNFAEEDLADVALLYKDAKGYGEFFEAYKYALECDWHLRDRLVEFDEYIKELRFRANFIGAKGALDYATKKCYYVERLLASSNGKAKVKRLRRFISLCESFGGSLTVSEMLDKIEKNKDAFTLIESVEDNTVKVSTMHSSKGLEFPVVIVCGTEKGMNEQDMRSKIMYDNDLGIAVRYYDDKERTYSSTPLRALLKQRMHLAQMKEEMRLFYVALTRAKYVLHVTCECENDQRAEKFVGAKKFIDFIPSGITITTLSDEDKIFEQKKTTRKVIIGKTDDEVIEQMQNRFAFKYSYQDDTTLPLKTNVTAINISSKYELGESEYKELNFQPVLDVENVGATGKESGTVAHKILENYDFDGLGLKEQSRQLVLNGVLTSEEVSSVDLDRLEKALSSAPFNGIKSKQIRREQGFLVNIPASMIYDTQSTEPVLVQGVIDLLLIDGENAQIIDYKYSRLDNERLKATYKKQLDLYAYATEKVLKKKVTNKTLVNIYSGEVVAID